MTLIELSPSYVHIFSISNLSIKTSTTIFTIFTSYAFVSFNKFTALSIFVHQPFPTLKITFFILPNVISNSSRRHMHKLFPNNLTHTRPQLLSYTKSMPKLRLPAHMTTFHPSKLISSTIIIIIINKEQTAGLINEIS